MSFFSLPYHVNFQRLPFPAKLLNSDVAGEKQWHKKWYFHGYQIKLRCVGEGGTLGTIFISGNPWKVQENKVWSRGWGCKWRPAWVCLIFMFNFHKICFRHWTILVSKYSAGIWKHGIGKDIIHSHGWCCLWHLIVSLSRDKTINVWVKIQHKEKEHSNGNSRHKRVNEQNAERCF